MKSRYEEGVVYGEGKHIDFLKFLEKYSCLDECWQPHDAGVGLRLNIDLLEHYYENMSAGDQHFVRFACSVWNPDNDYSFGPFDLVSALKSLEGSHRDAVIDWVSNPFWP